MEGGWMDGFANAEDVRSRRTCCYCDNKHQTSYFKRKDAKCIFALKTKLEFVPNSCFCFFTL